MSSSSLHRPMHDATDRMDSTTKPRSGFGWMTIGEKSFPSPQIQHAWWNDESAPPMAIEAFWLDPKNNEPLGGDKKQNMDSEKQLHDAEHAVSHDHQSMLFDRLQNMDQKHQHQKETSPQPLFSHHGPIQSFSRGLHDVWLEQWWIKEIDKRRIKNPKRIQCIIIELVSSTPIVIEPYDRTKVIKELGHFSVIISASKRKHDIKIPLMVWWIPLTSTLLNFENSEHSRGSF